jgi:hypothetical protein
LWAAKCARCASGIIFSKSEALMRGDEANLNPAVPGYTLVNLDAHVVLLPGCEVYGQVTNLFDRHYVNLGVMGTKAYTANDEQYRTDMRWGGQGTAAKKDWCHRRAVNKWLLRRSGSDTSNGGNVVGSGRAASGCARNPAGWLEIVASFRSASGKLRAATPPFARRSIASWRHPNSYADEPLCPKIGQLHKF